MANLKNLIALDNPFRLLYHKIRAVVASTINGFPAKDMTIVGVTGTNGKSTTCNIIAKGLKASGKKVFMFTTINIIIGDTEYVNETKMTTPDSFLLQKLLRQAKYEGCTIAIIETASHGIKMSRTWGIQYDILVLTNITQDHLDLHKTMDDYVKTKLKIFKELITYKRKPGVKKSAIINGNSEYVEKFLDQTYDSLYIYGQGKGASLTATNVNHKDGKMMFDVKMPGIVLHISTSLKGDFNIENILASIGVFISFGIKEEKIPTLIEKVSSVPGRMESVPNHLGVEIIVDYAHTPDALEKVLLTLKDYGYKRIITIFGATGDRDKIKRPTMGEIVSKNSDIIILTQDDDYSEKTEKIIKDILPGINREEGETFMIIPTRREALEVGIATIQEGDVLLVAGKGDEHVLITNGGAIEWHDRSVIEEILKTIDDNQIIS